MKEFYNKYPASLGVYLIPVVSLNLTALKVCIGLTLCRHQLHKKCLDTRCSLEIIVRFYTGSWYNSLYGAPVYSERLRPFIDHLNSHFLC